MRKDSPEDRLLSLIKGKYKKKTEIQASTSSVPDKSFFTDVTKKVFLKNKAFKPSFLKPVNKILLAILIILLLYLINSFFFIMHRTGAPVIREKTISPLTKPIPREITSPGKTDYSDYAKRISGKQLFTAPFTRKTEEGTALELDISKRFALVGIIAGDQPQAIIEDKEMQKTHYLHEGQSFSGVTLEEIGEGKVILNYGGQQIILVL